MFTLKNVVIVRFEESNMKGIGGSYHDIEKVGLKTGTLELNCLGLRCEVF